MENYPDFEKLAHVVRHGLKGVIARHVEDGSTEANNLVTFCRRRLIK